MQRLAAENDPISSMFGGYQLSCACFTSNKTEFLLQSSIQHKQEQYFSFVREYFR